jgi:hypothetical protein
MEMDLPNGNRRTGRAFWAKNSQNADLTENSIFCKGKTLSTTPVGTGLAPALCFVEARIEISRASTKQGNSRHVGTGCKGCPYRRVSLAGVLGKNLSKRRILQKIVSFRIAKIPEEA